MEVSGQFHAPAVLTPGKSQWYPLHKRLGGLQSRSGHGGEEKNSKPLPGLELPIIQPVAQRYTTELSRLPKVANMVEVIQGHPKRRKNHLQSVYRNSLAQMAFCYRLEGRQKQRRRDQDHFGIHRYRA
jgi:hypothetical protein